ncbi:uncharacterized protein LOC107359403 [Tetranychus urticae]|uniref:Intradiol ring-cleavage dioxygenases domain-containing protein n=1 Tax=Tetranychus urticae TaxID=32264 RepID=T1K3G7_TETUR|nr:uncharacterized protein LOC107359403 [Tetranychus urticae]
MFLIYLIIGCLIPVAVLSDPDYVSPRTALPYNSSITNCQAVGRARYQHSCVLAPMVTAGPYFIPEPLRRINIRENEIGSRMDLIIAVTNSRNCRPVSNADVYIWHANAFGNYSGFNDLAGVQWADDGNSIPQLTSRWLRGVQRTGLTGQVRFVSIVPGWYRGRSLHIHIEIRMGNNLVYVGQLFFTEEFGELLEQVSPYNTVTTPRTINPDDIRFQQARGAGILTTTGDFVRGIRASITLGIEPTRTVSDQLNPNGDGNREL